MGNSKELPSPEEALQKAIQIKGSQFKLASAIGCSQPSVFKMIKKGFATAEFVLSIEKATGVSRSYLRPDLYPPEEYPPKEMPDQHTAVAS